MKKAILQVNKLSIHLKGSSDLPPLVDAISFDLFPGEIVGLVGHSGSGKSLTAHALLDLLPAHSFTCSGEIYFHEQNILKISEKEMGKYRGANIGLIPQDPGSSLNPLMCIGDQLVEGLIYHKKMPKQLAYRKGTEWLERVGIGDASHRMKQYPHEISGGMKQRILIAMALACEPQIIIADEPTTALDVTTQQHVLELLKDLQKEMHLTLLLITHDIGVAASCCDRVFIMKEGTLIETGSTEQLFYSPQQEYTRTLLHSTTWHLAQSQIKKG